MAKNGFTMSKRLNVESITDTGSGNAASDLTTRILKLEDCGKTFLMATSGNVSMTLPSASINQAHGIEASGWNIEVRFTKDAAVAADNNISFQINTKYAEVASNADNIDGLVVGGDKEAAASGEVSFFTGSGTNNQIFMNSSTGYAKGTHLKLYTTGDGTWHVDGTALMTGTIATPFATES
jgi:hypothetical protein|tara:strand:+ start:60 stop:602 length:543 start_codon:yes stop_codon:yes gene_type:complete